MGLSMEKSGKLSVTEFLADIRFVITSPTRRFPVILERGAVWGSIMLLVAPVYFGFWYSGGIYFDREPFPGYLFLMPAVMAIVAQLVKAYFIHFCARMFEGRWRYFAATGRFRDMLILFGYSSVPGTLAAFLGTLLFFLAPGHVGTALRDFRVLTMSFLIAVVAGLFVWNLILFVLAMRLVYPMRDYKIVAALLIGSIIIGLVAAGGATSVSARVRVRFAYFQPLISPRMVGFFTSDSEDNQGRQEKIGVDIDKVAYRFKVPKRFDLVSYEPSAGQTDKEPQGKAASGRASVFSWHSGDQIAGRIVGVPGDTVELLQGKLRINGQFWAEPYISTEFQTDASLPPIHLGAAEYVVLPDNRHLVGSDKDDFVVPRARITGRVIVVKWPMGWAMFRPTAFLHAHPLGAGN